MDGNHVIKSGLSHKLWSTLRTYVYMSHPLDEIIHLMKSYAVHEMETVFLYLVK